MANANRSAEARYRLVAQYFAQTRDKKRALLMAGYTESYATARGFKIFEREDVKAYVDEYMKLVQERNDLTIDWVISQYMNIASVDATDIVQIVTKDKLIDGQVVPYQDIEMKDTAELTLAQRKAIKSIKYNAHGIAIEMYSKDVALGKLGEYLGMFKQDIGIKLQVDEHNPLEGLTTEELKMLIASKGV
jgi:phage terminase small subunit